MIRLLVLMVLVILGAAVQGRGTDIPELVGDLGTTERIVFEGQQTFSERQLRNAVEINIDLIVAGHPNAKLAEFLNQIQIQIEAGYQQAGFPVVAVGSTYDPIRDAVIVSIVEGARYLNGNIEIEGAVSVPKQRIREYLTQWRPMVTTTSTISRGKMEAKSDSSETSKHRKSEPLWEVDRPTSFSDPYRRKLKNSIPRCFQQFGYYKPDFVVDLRPEKNGTTTLVLTIRQQGPKAVLGEVEVSGNKKNSNDDIVQYLGTSKGMLLTSELTAELKQKLRASGRFLKQNVEVIDPSATDVPCRLKVTVYENPKAPSLNEEFTPVEQAALRVGNWFEGLSDSKDDLVVEAQWTDDGVKAGDGNATRKPWKSLFSRIGRAKKSASKKPISDDGPRTYLLMAVISPGRQEALINFRVLRSQEVVLFDGTLVARQKQLIFDSTLSKVRCELPTRECRFRANAEITSHPPDKDGHTNRANFGIGLAGDFPGSHSAITTTFDPACVLGFIERFKLQPRLEGDQLILSDTNADWSFDAKSGRLLNVSGVLGQVWKADCTMEAAPGLYDKYLDEHSRATEEWDVIRIDEAPFASAIAFFASNSGVISTEEAEKSATRLMGMARRWQTLERSRPLFELHDDKDGDQSRPGEFRIPIGPQSSRGFELMNEFVLPVVSRVVPKESPMWTILREFAFVSTGHSEHTSTVIASVFEAGESGPLSHLAGAWVFGLLSPKLRDEFATRGLKKLNLRDFQIDYVPFLNEQTPIGKALISLGTLLQDCDETEIIALVDLLDLAEGPARQAVIRSLRHFPQQRNQPSKAVIPMALDELWTPIIRPRLELLLSSDRAKSVPKSSRPVAVKKASISDKR